MTHNPGIALAVGALFALSACSENQFQPPPPPPVEVAMPAQRDVIDYVDFSGTTESFEIVEIRARVQGFLQQVAYREGEPVAENSVMFQIDPAPFVAARDAAKARVVQAQAEAPCEDHRGAGIGDRLRGPCGVGDPTARGAGPGRGDGGRGRGGRREGPRDPRVGSLLLHGEVAESRVAPRRPRSRSARWWGRSRVRRSPASEDANRIYVWFSRLRSSPPADARRRQARRPAPGLPRGRDCDRGGSGPLARSGRLRRPGRRRANSALLRVGAVVENPAQQLVGGLFVRVRLASATLEKALLVPDAAIASDQAGRYVYVVDDENTVVRRAVELGPRDGADRVVTAGINATDRVIVEPCCTRPGGKVTPKSAGS